MGDEGPMGSDERALRPPEPPPSFIPFQIGGATCLGGLTGAAWATLRGKPIISTGLTVAAHTVGVSALFFGTRSLLNCQPNCSRGQSAVLAGAATGFGAAAFRGGPKVAPAYIV